MLAFRPMERLVLSSSKIGSSRKRKILCMKVICSCTNDVENDLWIMSEVRDVNHGN